MDLLVGSLMRYHYTPVLDLVIDLYRKPRDPQQRFFNGYLKLIQTPDKKDLQLPLPFFNPMAKDHILTQLLTLKEMWFEGLMEAACTRYSDPDGPLLETFFNLADDVAGGWTTRESTHEISLKIRPFVTRGFCVVVFYASEDITPALIDERVRFYCDLYRDYPL